MHGKQGRAPSEADPSKNIHDDRPVDSTVGAERQTGAAAEPDDVRRASDGQADPAAGAVPAGDGRPAAADSELAAARAELASAKAENADLNDRFLRKVADLENYRKRMAREMEDVRLYANTEILLDLVSLLDDFDRAIQSSEAGKEWKGLHDGVQMIQKAFLGKLESRYGLKRFDSVGEPFDPTRHEALMAEKRSDVESPVVLEDFMKGYCLHERVIRPAKVKVAMPAAGGSGEAEAGAAPQDGGAAQPPSA